MNAAKKRWVPYAFLSPYLLFYLAFGLFPIVFSFYVSLTSWDGIGDKTFVGLDNYKFLFNPDSYFFKSVGNTLLFVVLTLPVQIALGLVIATLLYSRWVKWRGLFQLINFLPYIVTPVAVGLMFNLLFDWQAGFVNKVLLKLGLVDEGIYWLGEPLYARMVIVLMLIWKGFGYTMVFYLAGLANVPKDLHEAAQVDGASGLRTFFSITLPLLKPVTVFIVITGIIGGFQLLEEPMLLLTGSGMGSSVAVIGGPERCCLTTVWNMYDTAYGSTTRYGLGAAIAYGLCVIIAVFSFVGARFYRGDSE
ncbi:MULTISPECIES: carbohydrate ABC transporter permease [Cohnella]|jgi:multiple sugar transport system permease protein/cellobiose transport system permease protein|uniref:carbohydrate ABC transporter permease n=1 Tax=Cohnella TaxID=329857 RepID=UPI0003712A85|nr:MULTISPECIES: sugar ABC transporter permease [Cohnella]REK63227.1 MAG: sugar ABC transporter permease [Cohnella sp.]